MSCIKVKQLELKCSNNNTNMNLRNLTVTYDYIASMVVTAIENSEDNSEGGDSYTITLEITKPYN